MASGTRRQVALASRTPEMLGAFKEGVESIFRQWTALELAVHHGWGGIKSEEKAHNLVAEVLGLFYGPDKVYKDVITLSED